MALIQDGRSQTGLVAIEGRTKALRVSTTPRGIGFSFAATSGLVAAAQAAGSTFFAMRLATGWGYVAFIERMRIQYTTIGAYTTSITAGRRLAIYRGFGANLSGGTALASPAVKDSTVMPSSGFASAQGGDCRIATTTTLTATGVTYDTQQFREITLTSNGAAGSTTETIFDFSPNVSSPIIIAPGQILAIRNPQAMDAAGTWQLQVDIDWHESVPWNSTTPD